MKNNKILLSILAFAAVMALIFTGCVTERSEPATAEPTVALTAEATPDGTPTPRVIPTYVPTNTPEPVLYSQSPHAEVLEYDEENYAKLRIMQAKIIEDVRVWIIGCIFDDNYLFENNEYVKKVKVHVEIENQGTEVVKVRPQDTIMTLSTGETELVSEGFENEEEGILEPGKTIKLELIFRFRVTNLREIIGFNFQMLSPTDMNDNSLGEDYIFSAEFKFPDYEEISQEDIIRRAYNYWHALISGFEGLERIYPNQFVGTSGPITLHIPLASTLEFNENSSGTASEMVVLPVIAEFDSEEGFYYFLEHSAVVLSSSEKKVDCDADLSTARQIYFTGGGFMMALLSYDVTGLGVEDDKYFGFSNEAPYTKDAVYLGEGIVAVLDIEEQN